MMSRRPPSLTLSRYASASHGQRGLGLPRSARPPSPDYRLSVQPRTVMELVMDGCYKLPVCITLRLRGRMQPIVFKRDLQKTEGTETTASRQEQEGCMTREPYKEKNIGADVGGTDRGCPLNERGAEQ